MSAHKTADMLFPQRLLPKGWGRMCAWYDMHALCGREGCPCACHGSQTDDSGAPGDPIAKATPGHARGGPGGEGL